MFLALFLSINITSHPKNGNILLKTDVFGAFLAITITSRPKIGNIILETNVL
jgi:hypothetical protein